MKYKSSAIALTYTKYGDSSIISKIFTKEKGLQTFIVKGVRSKKSKTNLVCFEPLKLSEITASYNNKSSLQIIKQIALTISLYCIILWIVGLLKQQTIKNR